MRAVQPTKIVKRGNTMTMKKLSATAQEKQKDIDSIVAMRLRLQEPHWSLLAQDFKDIPPPRVLEHFPKALIFKVPEIESSERRGS